MEDGRDGSTVDVPRKPTENTERNVEHSSGTRMKRENDARAYVFGEHNMRAAPWSAIESIGHMQHTYCATTVFEHCYPLCRVYTTTISHTMRAAPQSVDASIDAS